MRIRLALTFDIGRRQEPDDDFEHRDTDSATENSFGGDPSTHRMGFAPAPEYDDRRAVVRLAEPAVDRHHRRDRPWNPTVAEYNGK